MQQLHADLYYEICRHLKKDTLIPVGALNSTFRAVLMNWRVEIDEESSEKGSISVWQMLGYRGGMIDNSPLAERDFFVTTLIQGLYMVDQEFIDFALFRISQIHPLNELKKRLTKEQHMDLQRSLLGSKNLSIIKKIAPLIDMNWEQGFTQACGLDDVEIIKYCLKNCRPNGTPLMEFGFMSACEKDAFNAITYLTNMMGEVLSKYQPWQNIGLYVASSTGSMKMINFMLTKGASNYQECIDRAKEKGCTEIINRLTPLLNH